MSNEQKELELAFDKIKDELKNKLNISTKKAEFIIDFLISTNDNQYDLIIEKINYLRKNVYKCQYCHIISYDKKCKICDDIDRENNILFVVEDAKVIEKIEKNNLNSKNKYFIIPYLYNKKQQLIKNDFNFGIFLNYIESFNEIFIAYSPTIEGILTSTLIQNKINNTYQNNKKKISILPIGIPYGLELDYIDELTLNYLIENRKEIK